MARAKACNFERVTALTDSNLACQISVPKRARKCQENTGIKRICEARFQARSMSVRTYLLDSKQYLRHPRILRLIYMLTR